MSSRRTTAVVEIDVLSVETLSDRLGSFFVPGVCFERERRV